MCEVGETTAPSPDSRTEVEQFTTSRRGEPSYLPCLAGDDEAVDARVGDLSLPAVANPLFRKGICLLRKDVTEARNGTLPLHCQQDIEVFKGEWL